MTLTKSNLLSLTIYLLSLTLYLHPLTLSPTPSTHPSQPWNLITNPTPQLDELHILDPSNHDVNGPNNWKEAWSNDYWGRPLDSSSSHKSWRPVSVWSFRFWKGQRSYCRWIVGRLSMGVAGVVEGVLSLFGWGLGTADRSTVDGVEVLASELFTHRFVNVLLHSCLVQLIGVVTLLLFPNQTVTAHLAQLLFTIHPTHVEAVANAANRPHLLGLLFNVATVDPSFPLVGVALCNMAGLLSAETALFQLPAVMLSMTAIRYRELLNEKCKQQKRKQEESNEDEETSILYTTITSLLPRYTILLLSTTLYLTHRLSNNSLSIPQGLIRPAENPFYTKPSWSYLRRLLNYSYVTALHVGKSLGVEIVGYSHEYGYDCVREMKVYEDGLWVLDLRLGLPFLVVLGCLRLSLFCWRGGLDVSCGSKDDDNGQQQQLMEERIMRMLLLMVFFAWMATLFPIMGILKVGTFIADRIVIPSTVGSCIFGARCITHWMTSHRINTQQTTHQQKLIQATKTITIIPICTKYLAIPTHNRISDWMDSVPLLQSSLRACPRSIKSNLEMSKLYSGLVPHMTNFKKALQLIQTAQTIDPTYCDVHHQYAHVYFQQAKYQDFEEAMVRSLMCPFTMGQAMTNWKRYWNAVLAPQNGRVDGEARRRYDGYMKRIEESIQKEADIPRISETLPNWQGFL